MNDEMTVLHDRVAVLERESRRLRRISALALTGAVVFSVWNSRSNAQPSADSLRVRGLIVEDSNGRLCRGGARITDLPVDNRR